MHVPIDAPALTSFVDRAVADDAVAVADDAHVLLEVELQPLVLQIGLRERALGVQRRLERPDELGHRGRVGSDGGREEGVLHAAARYVIRAGGRR